MAAAILLADDEARRIATEFVQLPPMTAKNAATPSMRSSPNEHYEMKPHRSAADPRGRYDSALIIFRE